MRSGSAPVSLEPAQIIFSCYNIDHEADKAGLWIVRIIVAELSRADAVPFAPSICPTQQGGRTQNNLSSRRPTLPLSHVQDCALSLSALMEANLLLG